jgi:hypothetical protein
VGALRLTPRLATGMTIRVDIPPAWPTVIGTMALRTKVVLCVDRAAPTPRERQQRRRCRGRLEVKCNGVFTRITAWLMDQARKGCGRFGAFLDGLSGRRRRLERCRSPVSPCPPPEPAEPTSSEHQQCIKERIVSHGASLPSCWKEDRSPDDASRQLSVRSRYTTFFMTRRGISDSNSRITRGDTATMPGTVRWSSIRRTQRMQIRRVTTTRHSRLHSVLA